MVKVKLYKMVNRLKMRLGYESKDTREGYIDPAAIKEADALIKDLCKDCHERLGEHLKVLDTFWDEMSSMGDNERRQELSQNMFMTAHEIKDIGSMCGYSLIAFFAESLRDFVESAALNLDAQRVIIQAHIDAMKTTHSKNVQEDTGPVAEELKRLVRVAVDKYM